MKGFIALLVLLSVMLIALYRSLPEEIASVSTQTLDQLTSSEK